MQSACEACPLGGMETGIFLSMLWIRSIFEGSILVSIPVITIPDSMLSCSNAIDIKLHTWSQLSWMKLSFLYNFIKQ